MSGGREAHGPSVNRNGPELEPAPGESCVRSRGTRVTVGALSTRLVVQGPSVAILDPVHYITMEEVPEEVLYGGHP